METYTLEEMLSEIDDYYCLASFNETNRITTARLERKQKVLEILEKFFGKQEKRENLK